jgi:hypothetical protein
MRIFGRKIEKTGKKSAKSERFLREIMAKTINNHKNDKTD